MLVGPRSPRNISYTMLQCNGDSYCLSRRANRPELTLRRDQHLWRPSEAPSEWKRDYGSRTPSSSW